MAVPQHHGICHHARARPLLPHLLAVDAPERQGTGRRAVLASAARMQRRQSRGFLPVCANEAVYPHVNLDRSIYLNRLGDPSDWSGDWRRPGNYLHGEQQIEVQERLRTHHQMVVGMAIRGIQSSVIAAVFGVSRETVDRRLRPLGLKNAPGNVGRPATRRTLSISTPTTSNELFSPIAATTDGATNE